MAAKNVIKKKKGTFLGLKRLKNFRSELQKERKGEVHLYVSQKELANHKGLYEG